MANLKGSTFDKQIRNANFRLAAFKEKRNGTNSHKTHSNATRVKRDMYFRDFKEFAEDSELEGKLNELMTEENLSQMFEDRLENLAYSTQEDYIRGWSGLVQGLQQRNVTINLDANYFNDTLEIYKLDAMDRGESVKSEPKPVTTPFHPTYVIEQLSEPFATITKLKHETGLRISEVYEVVHNLEKYLSELKLNNVKGKGGQKYRDKIISLELKLMLLKLKEQQIHIPCQNTYYRHLQVYGMRPHDIRAFYTKELYEKKIEEGYSHKEACKIVSKEINHHRIKITEYYLAKFQ